MESWGDEIMGRLVFSATTPGKFIFQNDEGLVLGWLEKIRVGTWMHWCYFLNKGCYLSPGCSDEVRAFQRQLGSHSTRETK